MKLSLTKVLNEIRSRDEVRQIQKLKGAVADDDEVMTAASLPSHQGPREKQYGNSTLNTMYGDFDTKRMGEAILSYVSKTYPEKFNLFKRLWDDQYAIGSRRSNDAIEDLMKFSENDEKLSNALYRYFEFSKEWQFDK